MINDQIWKALVRKTERTMCNIELKDRIFCTKISGFASTSKLQKFLDKSYPGAEIDVHYVPNEQYGGYLGRLAIIFETPEDHCAFRLKHGHKFL